MAFSDLYIIYSIWIKTLPTNGNEDITVKIDAKLYTEVKQYFGSHEITMAKFVTLALQNKLHTKINMREKYRQYEENFISDTEDIISAEKYYL